MDDMCKSDNKIKNYKDAAIICMQRKPRFYEGYNNANELNELINKFFPIPDSTQNKIHHTGLRYAHSKMYDYIIEKNLISLILYGEKYGSTDTIFYYYVEGGCKRIPISINGVCKVFLQEFISEETIKKECLRTPMISNYYSGDIGDSSKD